MGFTLSGEKTLIGLMRFRVLLNTRHVSGQHYLRQNPERYAGSFDERGSAIMAIIKERQVRMVMK